jgi:hypothetical protein
MFSILAFKNCTMIKLVSTLSLIAILLSSCQKELDGVVNNNTTGGGAGTGGGGSVAECKNCIYIPICDGSVYKYVDTVVNVGVPPTITNYNYTLRVLADTTIGGVVFQKTKNEDATLNPISYYNCNAGITTSINYNAVSTGGTSVSEIRQVLLKANAAVGDTWTNTINYSGQTVTFTNKIMQKGVARTVNGITYNDVIVIKVDGEVSAFGVVLPFSTGYNYCAKGIGAIESYSETSGIFGNQYLHRILVSAQIP